MVTKHCQPLGTPSLGGDARVPRPGSRAWLPSGCAPRPALLPRGPRRDCRARCKRAGARGHPALHFWGVGRLGGAADGARGGGVPRKAALPTRLPGFPRPRSQGAPRLGTGRARRRREEAGHRGNNVVGCFADCQPRSRILLSTPLGLTATGPARRGKSPLIWSWKERGKVILRCLRRWVIGPQLLARTRLRCRLPPVGGGAGQRLAEAPELVNKPRRFRYLGLGVFFCVRAGRGVGVVASGGGGRGRRKRGGRARKEENNAFFNATAKPSKSASVEGVTLPCRFHVTHLLAHRRMRASVSGSARQLGCRFLEEHQSGTR